MHAIVVEAHGGPDVLRLQDVPAPTAEPGHVVIKLAYAGVNFVDVYVRTGLYKSTLPVIPGDEGAGVVTTIGAGVDTIRLGDRVAYAGVRGSYAEYATVPADKLMRVPPTVSLRDAAAVMLQGVTAHYLARSTYSLTHTDTALVHAAAGGVGQLLVQIAKHAGARVIATVSTEPKAQIARTGGADHVILYSTEDVALESRRLTNGRGVDVVYDGVGAATWTQSLDSLRVRGLMVSYGNASGPVPAFAPLVLSQKGSLFLTRPAFAHYVATRAELESRATDLFTWLIGQTLRLSIDRILPLARAADAHRALEGRQTTGKVLLAIDPSLDTAA